MRCSVLLSFILALGCAGSSGTSSPPTTESAKPGLRHAEEVRLSNIVQLTRDVGENAEAYWSPDGDELVFQSTREPYKCDQIFRMAPEKGATPTLVSTGTGRTTCAYFTHDNKRIVYASTHVGGEACPPTPDHSQGYVWPLYDSFDIFSALPDGSDLKQLTKEPGYDAEATICPVDGSIIFTSTRDGDIELYRMDADGGNVKRLTHTPGYDGGAFFSADCSKIVWRASRPEGKALDDYKGLLAKGLVRPSRLEVFVADADGRDARQITYLGAASFAPYFHPSGRRILFSTNYPNPRGREFNIWSVGVDGAGLEQVTFAEGFDGFPMFSPDGSKLAFSSNRGQAKEGQTDIYVADWVEDVGPKAAGSGSAGVDRIAKDISWLADDAREGRGIGTKGLDKAASYVEHEFRQAGVEPAFDTGFRQTMAVPVSVSSGGGTKLVIGGKGVPLTDFKPLGLSASAAVTARTVWLGYGIVGEGRNDYRGKRVKGRVAIIQRFVPTDKAFSDARVSRRYSDLHYKAFLARERGAVAVIFVDAAKAGADGKEAPLPELRYESQGNVSIPVVAVKHAVVERFIKRPDKASVVVALVTKSENAANVVGVIRGTKPDAGAIVIGAHYDHLGYGDSSSLEAKQKGVHNGADDNASGTAVLIEVARQLRQGPKLDRDVYLAAFAAEELGVLGSRHFVRQLPKGLETQNIRAMINMDMVGRMRRNVVSILGGATAPQWEGLVRPACESARIRCELGGSGYGPSDQTSFYSVGVPVLHFFTGAHSDYHKTSDDTEEINAAGAAHIAQAVGAIATSSAAATARFDYTRIAAPLPKGDSRGFSASLGTIPDYGPNDGADGMAVSDVRPGGPAEKAGIRRGDRLIEIAGTKIGTVRDLVHVLRSAKPGQGATAVVMRDGKRIELEVVFGEARRSRGSRH